MGREGTAEESGGDRPRALLWLAWWVCFFVFYMLLAGTLVASELIAGAAAAAVAASVAELVRVQDARRFRPRLVWIIRARRLPVGVVRDTFVLFAALWRHLSGKQRIDGAFRAFYYPVAGEGGRASARRALLNAALSLSPNTFVVGIDEEREQILVHQLVPSEHARTKHDLMSRL